MIFYHGEQNIKVLRTIYGELPKIEDYQETEFCSMDGMNFEGLAVNVLADAQSTCKDVKEPGANKISTIRFSQYLLDRFATVKKAVKHIKKNELFLFNMLCCTDHLNSRLEAYVGFNKLRASAK